ncbi:putative enzyme related to lactoylglutathione lyase [Metabacillus crassostreae]|uniref:VOC family protein n=1 Tax=Metabacillus crassostreae TaxID=929098 RepID=UPI00195679D4|nr:VOC family protein [Metabacillus crassostreae]MBM7602745.1 putative enzyme related to lactoylglutathione lyase [Metabacillus crassostreae]
MSSISSKAGAIFIPVSNVLHARDWYCSILNLEPNYEIIAGHLCCIPFDNNGLNLVLDSKIYNKESLYKNPAFHFNTDDIHKAYQSLKKHNVEFVTDIENGHWFNFKDPDGNLLMVCKC